uniref:Uncharacterized protein n=1 Tax=Osmundaria fimbriata TaxID=228265 RepID=A0A1Z1M4J6_OSMFI|nr:hypothetical protein [Osmundaria fimbriata]ARW60830.1 hypothetical protein [Osmundaria fimbriata]
MLYIANNQYTTSYYINITFVDIRIIKKEVIIYYMFT